MSPVRGVLMVQASYVDEGAGREVERLLGVVERLTGELASSQERNAVLVAQVVALSSQVAELTARVGELTARLGANSSNSGVPPSKDPPGAPSRSLRKKTGRRPGGQAGHEGKTLAVVDSPDRVVEHRPHLCAGCGHDLQGRSSCSVEARQVFDLPADLCLEVVEHRLASVRCPSCRTVTKATAPPGVVRQVQYGPNVASVAVHMVCSHYVAVDRAANLLADLFGRKVSPATVTAMVDQAAAVVHQHARPVIARLLATGPVAHADETGFKVAGTTWWAHSLSNPAATWIAVHPNRGKKATDDIGLLPTFTGTLVHDAWATYDTYLDLSAHQLCCAHVLRELQAVQDHHDHAPDTWCWAEQTAAALSHIIADPTTVATYRPWITSAGALATADDPGPPGLEAKHAALRRRLKDRLADYLRFTTDPAVPATNNPAEQEIRMVKIKQKVSGGMRTGHGARSFTTIRSYLSTARKHAVAPLQALASLGSDNIWLPATP